MEEWMVGAGWTLREGDCGPTWERTREGRRESSRIDFVICKGNSEWTPIKSRKLLSDHWAIHGEWEVDMTGKVDERVAVDWRKLNKIVEDLKEKDSDEEDEKWYKELEGSSPYEKLKTLRTFCDKRMKVCEQSKRWWNNELSDPLKKTRRTRKEKEGEGINQEGRVKRWKVEKEKMRTMVREKKKECWKKFCKENGEKDP